MSNSQPPAKWTLDIKIKIAELFDKNPKNFIGFQRDMVQYIEQLQSEAVLSFVKTLYPKDKRIKELEEELFNNELKYRNKIEEDRAEGYSKGVRDGAGQAVDSMQNLIPKQSEDAIRADERKKIIGYLKWDLECSKSDLNFEEAYSVLSQRIEHTIKLLEQPVENKEEHK